MCILFIMAFYRKGLFLFLCFDHFMMFIYESNGCTYSSNNVINICSAGSTSGTRIGIRNKNVPNDKVVQCVCDLQAQSPTNFTVFFDGPGFNNCGTSVILYTNTYSCLDANTVAIDNIKFTFIGSTYLRTSPTLTYTSKPPPPTSPPPPPTTTPSTTQITTSLRTSSTLQSLLTPSKTSTRVPKDPDLSLGITHVFESNITITKTFSTTAIVLISIGFGLFVTVTIPVVIILALKRRCKQIVDHAANVRMTNIGNNYNPETNNDLQTYPDTDSLRYESLQNRTAENSYTNMQMLTGNQNKHLQHLYVGDSSTSNGNKNNQTAAPTLQLTESTYAASGEQQENDLEYETLTSRTTRLFNVFVTFNHRARQILLRSNKQKINHAAKNDQMTKIGNNSNPQTNNDLQTFPDTNSLRYESLQKRTADDSYTNLQMSTGNQNNHLQHLYVGDSSTGHRNENASATNYNESHYQNSSSQPLSVNSSARYESLNPRTGPLSDHCYSTLQT
ncbi:hypothetical protein MAR_027989 [Mya arenaria]|uniref:Uncharacterized protein n=1 Tax=Mya arenaria TaxID=6604 RepID=A0ABY7DFT5_MYAAR|nr:hypothetical protein MAR_027989 [Mya arenaria]